MKPLVLWSAVLCIVGVTWAQDSPYSCSASKPCKIGCCGKNNVCGLGPKYCSPENCVSTCDAKSNCDPGWGAKWSSKDKCPLNVCCSKFGFCGTTSEFCGATKVTQPSCSKGSSANKRVIGYYEGWSSTRECRGMYPEDLLSGQYTHLNFAFAFIDPNTFAVAPMSAADVTLYPRFTGLKKLSPGLETWISVGGWSMNDPDQPTRTTFSDLAASPAAQSKFFASLINFMSTYGFDGVDIDWEYPGASERSGKPADFKNYVSFLKNLKNALGSGGHKYGLTITLPSSYWYMQNFDIKAIEETVDWLNMMTYDLHGTWDSTDPYIGAFVNAHTNLTEITQTLDLLWRNKIDPGKVVMGMGFYGRSFTLSNPACKTAGCPFSGGGKPGKCSASAGTLMYSEINDVVAAGAKVTEDNEAGVAIVTWDNDQWVSFDNPKTLKKKLDYANSKCLGGIMIWAASTDDGDGTAIKALNGVAFNNQQKFSLWGAPKPPLGQCVWGTCNAGCPSGYSAATGAGGKVGGYAGIFSGCPDGQSRYYCCPTGTQPKCTWKGTAPFCKGSCENNEVEVTTSNSGTGKSCWTGHKALCCEHTSATTDAEQCKWTGSSPFCATTGVTLSPLLFWNSASCPKDHPKKLTTSKYGAGGEQPCLYNGGWKSYCCKEPVPYKNCLWHQGRSKTWSEWGQSFIALGLFHEQIASPFFAEDCKGECPAGQVPIASDATNCQPGTYSFYCCDNPNAPALPAPGEVSLCPSPSNIEGLTRVPDPNDPSPGGRLASHAFDGDCTLYSHPSRSKRDLYDSALSDWTYSANVTYADENELYARNLDKRTQDKSAALAFCLPNGSRHQLTPATYSGYRTVANVVDKGYIYIAKPLVCGAIGVIASSTQPAGVEVVTEHVMEKQTLRNAIQWMMEGLLPGGGKLSKGVAAFVGIFDANGIFFQAWPSNLRQTFGDSPMDTVFGYLGHAFPNADFGNLLVVDADLNAIKARIAAGIAIVSSATWSQYSNKQKYAFLADFIDTFEYMRDAKAVKSFSYAYRSVTAFWTVFARIPGAQRGYDYSGAFQEIIKADLNYQVKNAMSIFTPCLTEVTKIWNDPAIMLTENPVLIQQTRQALTKFAAQKAKLIALNVADMTK